MLEFPYSSSYPSCRTTARLVISSLRKNKAPNAPRVGCCEEFILRKALVPFSYCAVGWRRANGTQVTGHCVYFIPYAGRNVWPQCSSAKAILFAELIFNNRKSKKMLTMQYISVSQKQNSWWCTWLPALLLIIEKPILPILQDFSTVTFYVGRYLFIKPC